ncbi:MAG: AAA family ATPase [Candidatus Paceibacterota bacterium]
MKYTPLKNISSSIAGEKGAKNSDIASEIQAIEEKLASAQLPRDLYSKAHMQIDRITLALKHGGNMGQLDMLGKYVDWITSLPWEAQSQDILDLKRAAEVLEKNHYGLASLKKRVLEYLSILILQGKSSGSKFHAPILFFVGLAGTGKTTFAKSVAEALGKKFARIPFGGIASALDLRGVSKVQPEAEPGFIIKSLRRLGTRNPVILLDELDRVTKNAHGEIMGVLLEILDHNQNNQFVDHYIDYPFDLSQIMFIATANNTRNISTAVLDRLEVIQMPSYSDNEKISIAKNFILPRLMRESAIDPQTINVGEDVWKHMARASGFDPGIRSVERKVESLVRRVALQLVAGKGTSFVINEENMKEYIE